MITSAGTGLWSATGTWVGGVVPGNNSPVTIAPAHTVTFNVDHTPFADGLASLTVNGILRFTTAASTTTRLRVTGSITGTGQLFVGNSEADFIPRSSKSWIELLGAASTLNVATQNYFGWTPVRNHTTLAAGAAAGQPVVVLAEDLGLAPGDEIVLGCGTVVGIQTEAARGAYTVSTYVAGTRTVTLTANLQTARLAGDVAAWLSRPIEIIRTPGRDFDLIPDGSPGSISVARGVRWRGTRPPWTNNATIPFCTSQNNTSGGFIRWGSGNSIVSSTSQNNAGGGIINQGAGNSCISCVALNSTPGGFTDRGRGNRFVSSIGQNNTRGLDDRGITNGFVDCVGLHNTLGGITHLGSGHTVIGCTVRGNTGGAIAREGSSLLVVDTLVVGGGQDGILSNSRNVTLVRCISDEVVENAGYTGWLNPLHSYSESIDHGNVAGAYRAWVRGGNTRDVTDIVPPGATRAMRSTCETAVAPCYWQQRYIVPPNSPFVGTVVMRAEVAMTLPPRAQLIDTWNDPLANPSAVPLAEAVLGTVGAWTTLTLHWTNPSATPRPVMLRCLAQNATGNFWSVASANLDTVGPGIGVGVGVGRVRLDGVPVA